jgi:hypothetical protein
MKLASAFANTFAVVALLAYSAGGGAQSVAPQTAAPRTANARATAAQVSGTVADPTGAIIAGAQVRLLRTEKGNGPAAATVAATATTDSAGRFQLPQPVPGDYRLTVALPGFSTLTRTLHITASTLAPLALTMAIADVSTNVNVSADQDTPLADPTTNADATTLSADDMKNLPVFDADIVSTLAAFLDAGAAGEGGTTLVIDGVESKTVGVSPSTIERISVNQDPYSAQYRNPGRGQVEIVTRSAQERFHGELSFTFRDNALNANNYFATTKPASQRRIYEGYLTGPVLSPFGSKSVVPHTAFLFSFTRREAYNQAQVDATPLPTPAANITTPQLGTNLTFKLSHDYNDHHSAYLLYRFNRQSYENQNIGGQVLQSAGYNSYNFDMDVTYHDDLTLGANKLNQFSLLYERNLDRFVSNTHAPQYVVEGVTTFNGGTNDQYNTENNPNLSDIFSWTLKTRIPQDLKFGIQVPNQGRRILEDNTNRQGTYTFASLAAYQAGTPSAFSIQQGASRFQTVYSQPGAFVMDQIQLTPNLTVIPGLRYDYQDAIPRTKDGFEPHLSIAYVLDKARGFVVRTGGAVYLRRVGVNIGQQIARYSHAAERELLNTGNPCFPISAACDPAAGQAPSLYNYAPNIKSPEQGYFGLSVERNITKKSTLTLGYDGYRGWHALRSIDGNAPPPPFTSAVRPNPNYSQELVLDSGGYQKTDGMSLSYRGRIGDVVSGFLQYTWQHADADTQWSTFSPQNQYAPNDEWSRTDFDQRQRLSLFATLYPDKPFTLGVGFYDNTAPPYTETTGTDDYHTGLFNARPAGVPRNSLNAGDYQDLQVRLGYTLKLAPLYKAASEKDTPQTLAFSVSSFNTLNRVNFESYDGVVSSPEFMRPTSANAPRRLQLSASYTF